MARYEFMSVIDTFRENAASVIYQIKVLRNLDLVLFIVLFEISIDPLFSINPDQNRQQI